MTARMKSLGIDRLSPDARLELAQEIYESLETDALSEEHKRELDRRLAAYTANPNSTIPWEAVETDALARIRK